MQENKNIQEKEFEFEFDYSDIFGECYNHRFICITCKKLVDNFCLEFGDTKPEFVECENCGTKYVKQQECWVSNILVKVVLGDQTEKPKTKRFMTREEIMDFIFENRNKQMWLRYSNNGGWLMASSCIIGDGGIITYEYTFDKGKTIHNFEVEE